MAGKTSKARQGMDKRASGAIGENIALNELLWRGWAPVNANFGLRNTPNIDIIAAKGKKHVSLQIKASTDTANDIIEVGRGNKKKFFNSKDGPLAQFVVFLKIWSLKDYECYVVPVDIAEKEIARCYRAWYKTPKRSGEQRSENFPASLYLANNKNRPKETGFRDKWKKYKDAWDLLDIENL